MLKIHGPQGKSSSLTRYWSSAYPNVNFMNAYASGTFGKPCNRLKDDFEREEYEEAKAALEAWGVSGRVLPAPLDAPYGPAAIRTNPIPPRVPTEASEVDPKLVACVRRMSITKAKLNETYVAYEQDPQSQRANLFAAIYAFAGNNARLRDCKSLFSKRTAAIEPKDITSEFAMSLFERIEKGQYTHEGNLHSWINFIWKNGFFPDLERNFYKTDPWTVSVDESDYDDQDEQEPGVFYRAEVDAYQAKRDTIPVYDPSRRLTRKLAALEAVWDQLSQPTQIVMTVLRQGKTLSVAAQRAGLSERQASRLRDKAVALAGVAQ